MIVCRILLVAWVVCSSVQKREVLSLESFTKRSLFTELAPFADYGKDCEEQHGMLRLSKTTDASFRQVLSDSMFFPKASPMLGFSFSLLDGGVERNRTGPWCGRDLGWWSGMGVRYGMLWKMEERWYGMGVIRDGCDIRDVVKGGGAVWTGGRGWGCGWNREGERDWVWTGVDKGADGRWRGARLGVDGRGWGCGWKTEGSETGCERVWTGCGWKTEGSETGCGRAWTRVWMEDGGGARLGVDGCGQGRGWKMEGSKAGCGGGCGGSETGCGGGVDGGWGLGQGCRWKMKGSETGCGRVWTEDGGGARLGVDGCGWGCGWKMEGSETGCGRVWTGCGWKTEGERDWVWTGVDKGVDGRWRGAGLGVCTGSCFYSCVVQGGSLEVWLLNFYEVLFGLDVANFEMPIHLWLGRLTWNIVVLVVLLILPEVASIHVLCGVEVWKFDFWTSMRFGLDWKRSYGII